MTTETAKEKAVKSDRLLYLPPAIVRLALGADARKVDGDEVYVTLPGEETRAMSEEDFILASKIAVKLRQANPAGLTTRGALIDAVGQAGRMLSEEIFLAGAVRVLYFPTMAPGSLFYRCMMPTVAMNAGTRANAFISKNKVAREAANYDVVVFQIEHSPGTLKLVKELQGMGKKCVFEIDDAFDQLEEWHSFSDTYKRQDAIDQVIAMMRTCDAVVVSTNWLAERYRQFAKKIEVIPNMIPVDDWERTNTDNRLGEFRILWAGSPSHFGDLEIVGKALTRFVTEKDNFGAEKHPDAKLVFFGRAPVGLEVPEDRVEVHDFVDFSVYPQKLANLAADIAIAPLADVPFNLAKSNVKLLEYWATGYPVVASPVGPYLETITNGLNGLLCKTEDEWVEALDLLYRDQRYRLELRDKGMETVQLFNSTRLVGRVEDFFLSLAKG